MRSRQKVGGMTGGAIGLECRAFPNGFFGIRYMATCTNEAAAMIGESRTDVRIIHRCPSRCDMTIITGMPGKKMRRWLAARDGVVMARGAVPPRRGVVEGHCGPRCRDMTIVAGVGGPDVRRRFAPRHGVVVTAETRALRRGMIECDRQPRRRHMAVIAGVGGPDVRWGFAASHGVVVTAKAGSPG